VDVGTSTLIAEVTGESEKIDAMITVLESFGILEIMRTGKIAMTRGVVVPRNGSHSGVVRNGNN
jgi:acetolactate synthase-1/3 small subunit